MSDDTAERTTRPADEPIEDDDDVQGHVLLRNSAGGGAPDDDDDTEGHSFVRSPSSRGE